jgi:dTDP-4-amino-4,6-dideoxygalactose transaminase
LDSAAGFGASADDGVPIGAQGDLEVVSFHATKPFGIGEGGAVFTARRDLAERIGRLANFSFDEHRRATSLWGINAKLDELHCAVALAVLDHIDDCLAIRREIAGRLVDALGPDFQPQEGHTHGTYQMLPVMVRDGVTRDRILEHAAGRVELRTYYEPLHLMPAFASCPRAGSLAVTEVVASRVLSLPMAVDLTDAEISSIAEVCRRGADGSGSGSDSLSTLELEGPRWPSR